MRLNSLAVAAAVIFTNFISLSQAIAAPSKTADACQQALGFVQVDLTTPNLSFGGMTPKGFEALTKAQVELKTLTTNFNTQFESMETIFNGYTVAAAAGQNVMVNGGPGGAKSASILWAFPDIWVKQMHELISDMALIGGQTEAGMREGREEINHEGSLVKARFGLIDEGNNANPQVFATLMSLANPGERFVTVGGKKVFADDLRTIFFTGNATRYELLQSFLERGMQSGPAFLNRSLIKMSVPNWLSLAQQERGDEINELVQELKTVAKYGDSKAASEARSRLNKLQAPDVNWDVIDAFAQKAFVADENLQVAAREMANEFRLNLNGKVRASDEASLNDSTSHPVVFTPSAELTERLRRMLLKVIKYSAAIDFLLASESKDLSPEVLRKPIVLGPLSLWRSHLILTTVTSGVTRLNPATLSVEFGLIRNRDGSYTVPESEQLQKEARTVREKTEIEHLFQEQQIFNDILRQTLEKLKESSKEVAALMNEDPSKAMLENGDFELKLSRANRAR